MTGRFGECRHSLKSTLRARLNSGPAGPLSTHPADRHPRRVTARYTYQIDTAAVSRECVDDFDSHLRKKVHSCLDKACHRSRPRPLSVSEETPCRSWMWTCAEALNHRPTDRLFVVIGGAILHNLLTAIRTAVARVLPQSSRLVIKDSPPVCESEER
jgi:hypothetical protein